MPNQNPEALPYRVAALERRVDKNEARLDKMEQDSLRTDVAILKVEVTGLNKKIDVQDAELEFIKTRTTSTDSMWQGSKATIVMLMLIIGGVGGLIFGILQAVGGH